MPALTRCDVEIAVILLYPSDKTSQILDSFELSESFVDPISLCSG